MRVAVTETRLGTFWGDAPLMSGWSRSNAGAHKGIGFAAARPCWPQVVGGGQIAEQFPGGVP